MLSCFVYTTCLLVNRKFVLVPLCHYSSDMMFWLFKCMKMFSQLSLKQLSYQTKSHLESRAIFSAHCVKNLEARIESEMSADLFWIASCQLCTRVQYSEQKVCYRRALGTLQVSSKLVSCWWRPIVARCGCEQRECTWTPSQAGFHRQNRFKVSLTFFA